MLCAALEYALHPASNRRTLPAKLAETYNALGAAYQVTDKEAENKEYLKKRGGTVQQAHPNVIRYPQRQQCRRSQKSIQKPHLSFTTEWVARPDVPNLLLSISKTWTRPISVWWPWTMRNTVNKANARKTIYRNGWRAPRTENLDAEFTQ